MNKAIVECIVVKGLKSKKMPDDGALGEGYKGELFNQEVCSVLPK
jgi:hypothetical protein